MLACLRHLFSLEKRLASLKPCANPIQFGRQGWFYAVLALMLFTGGERVIRAADPYAAALDQHFESGSAPAPPADPGVAALEEGIKAQVREMSQRPEISAPQNASTGLAPATMLAGIMTAAIAVGLVVLLVLRGWNQWLDKQAAKREAAIAEDPLMVAFLRTLHEGLPLVTPQAEFARPDSASVTSPAGTQGHASTPVDSPPQPHEASKQIMALRADFLKLGRATGDTERLKILHEILAQVELVKEASNAAHSRSVRLLASALHGLLNQLSIKAANITPSALHTAAAAVDLLEHLCSTASRPDLATAPRVRLLAVDDDAISRRAVSLALKKAFNDPDLAPDGPTALELAVKQPYDLIFLDIEMPGMDGFELCEKIHKTEANRTTPVVFVTSHTDFGSRAKSALLGAHDLIGKPFLAFEITVKALSVVLRARQERGSKEACGQTERLTAVEPPVKSAAEAARRNSSQPDSFHPHPEQLGARPNDVGSPQTA